MKARMWKEGQVDAAAICTKCSRSSIRAVLTYVSETRLKRSRSRLRRPKREKRVTATKSHEPITQITESSPVRLLSSRIPLLPLVRINVLLLLLLCQHLDKRSRQVTRMDDVLCACIKCRTTLGRFKNAWILMGKDYYSPVYPCVNKSTGFEGTGDVYQPSAGTSVENRYA